MVIGYDDISYNERIRLLKDYFNSDKDAYITITTFAESINDNLDIDISHIEYLLIWGYSVYEKIYDDKFQNIIGIKQLNYSTLIPYYNNKEKLWISFPDSIHHKKVFAEENLYFLSYNKSRSNMGFSLADLLYRKMIDSSDTVYLNMKKRKLIHEFLKIDKNLLK